MSKKELELWELGLPHLYRQNNNDNEFISTDNEVLFAINDLIAQATHTAKMEVIEELRDKLIDGCCEDVSNRAGACDYDCVAEKTWEWLADKSIEFKQIKGKVKDENISN